MPRSTEARPRRPRQVALSREKKLLLFVVEAVAVVATLAAAAQLVAPDALLEPVVPNDLTGFDERLGWAPQPGARGVSSRTGSAVEYRINSKGLRDGETSYVKPENTFRIVLIGDSQTFGFGIPIEKHFSMLLEEQFRGLEVINLGVNGFGVDQELLYLRHEGFRYDPDLVIAYVPHFQHNRHMNDERWGMRKPRFKLIDGTLLLTDSVVVADTVEPWAASPLARLDRWCANRSKLYEIVSGGVLRVVGKPRGPNARQNHQDREDLRNPAFRKDLFDLGVALMKAMHDESAARGATFVLVTHIKDLHDSAVARQMLSLDVQEPLANPEFELPYGLMHLNEVGNRVLTAEIEDYLRSRHLIPARHLEPVSSLPRVR